jgi:beta-lactamase regulating signal transducer with metallopeptidase domain
VERCCTIFGVGRVTILSSAAVAGPVALGIRVPVLIFPEWFFSRTTEEELATSLCHELARVRRRDFLLNLLYELIALPVSFHPAAALIKARIDQVAPESQYPWFVFQVTSSP